jgi:NADH dehydrogenase [ubiquinone] 1 alpha subcomplex assembly factor 3
LQPSQRLTRQQQQRGVQDFLSKYTRPHEYSHGQNRVQVTAAESSWLSVNDIISRRSVLLFPTSFMLWKARLPADISSSSLALMKVVFPTLEMLVIGCGRSIHEVDREVRLAIAEEFRVHGTVVEFMDTKSAVSTFNVMNAEDRQVGAALLLPEPGPNEDDRIDLQALFADSEEPAGRSPSPSAPPSSLPSSAAPPPDPAAEASQSSKEGEGSRPAQYRKHKEIFSDSNK